MIDEALANVLYVDLGKKSARVERRPELFEQGLGGAGAAIKLLEEEAPAGLDPLSPQSPIILAVGPLTGLYPLASKTVAMFKSPLTGDLGESHCGGRSAIAIRMAGLGAIVIRGASERPLYLAVHGGKVLFRDASALWGMRGSATAARIIRQNEPGAGTRTIMRIGEAGENQVAYASVTAETYRHFGRMGLGAIFGSKKLKALVVSGKRSIPVASGKDYKKLYDQIYELAVSADLMKKYHDLGTAENVLPLNELGALPTRNLQAARFEHAPALSGEALARDFLGRRLACAHCPVGCIHLAAVREPYPDEDYFYKTTMVCYDFELIYALGSMLGLKEPKPLLRLIDEVERVGLDAISAGVVLAWAAEAFEQKLIDDKLTNGLRFAFGEPGPFIAAVGMIARKQGPLYAAMAQGVASAAEKFGGADFALAYNKNEMPGYHTGPAAAIGLLIGARHSHLDNAGYSLDQKAVGAGLPPPETLVDKLLEEESWRQVLASLAICFFARKIYSPELVAQALETAGYNLSAADLVKLGGLIHRDKYRFKLRHGFNPAALSPPRRVLQTPTPLGPISPDYVAQAIAHLDRLVSDQT